MKHGIPLVLGDFSPEIPGHWIEVDFKMPPLRFPRRPTFDVVDLDSEKTLNRFQLPYSSGKKDVHVPRLPIVLKGEIPGFLPFEEVARSREFELNLVLDPEAKFEIAGIQGLLTPLELLQG